MTTTRTRGVAGVGFAVLSAATLSVALLGAQASASGSTTSPSSPAVDTTSPTGSPTPTDPPPPPACATAAPPPVLTITWNGTDDPAASVTGTGGETVDFVNSSGATITVESADTGVTGWSFDCTVSDSGTVTLPTAPRTYDYEIVPASGAAFTGAIVVSAASSSPTPSPSRTTPTPVRTTAKAAPRTTAPAAAATTPTASPSASAAPRFDVALPGGSIPFAGLLGASASAVQAPLVAPLAAVDGGPASTDPAIPNLIPDNLVPGHLRVLADSTAGRARTRNLGLPAVVTAVLLAGVGAALLRVLLTHQGAIRRTRRH